jgi:hypothetical protein
MTMAAATSSTAENSAASAASPSSTKPGATTESNTTTTATPTATATATARTHPKAPPTLPSLPSTLIPVRVDVSSDDGKYRVIDTLLIDPTCFPIPLYSPLSQAVEDNVREIAYSILSDAECQGMVRHSSGKHFTGRIDLWNKKLQTKAEDQLRPQIWKIIDGKMGIVKRASVRGKVINNNNNNNQVSGLSPSAPENKLAAATSTTTDVHSQNGLIPIYIRLYTVHRIIIHEDILWDPYHSPITPLEFARELATELNLPAGDEAVIGITTCMLEQLYGLPMDETPDVSAKVTQQIFHHNNPASSISEAGGTGASASSSASQNVIEASSSSKEGLRGAYQMSENNNRNALSQFAQQHRRK